MGDDGAALARLEVDDGVGTIRLDRAPLNILNLELQRRLVHLATEADGRDDVEAIVFTGGERTLSAGADIAEMVELTAKQMQTISVEIQSFANRVAVLSKPTVAAITGHTLGGGFELALATDRRIAAADARVGLPELKLGVIPGAGGTQRLSRLIGASRAKDLLLNARILAADEALALGLVDEVVQADRVYARAVEWASAFVGGPRLAFAAVKRAIDGGLGASLSEGLEIERVEFARLWESEDHEIGIRALLSKQTPGFVGR